MIRRNAAPGVDRCGAFFVAALFKSVVAPRDWR
jgi:hypothetical protein